MSMKIKYKKTVATMVFLLCIFIQPCLKGFASSTESSPVLNKRQSVGMEYTTNLRISEDAL